MSTLDQRIVSMSARIEHGGSESVEDREILELLDEVRDALTDELDDDIEPIFTCL